MFKDGHGNISSFRVVWVSLITCIFGVWMFMCFKEGTLLNLPVDGITTIGLLSAPGIKTGAEYMKK